MRAAEVFAESILTDIGFWATPCYSIWYYIVGICDDSTSSGKQILMGEYTDKRWSQIIVRKYQQMKVS